MFVVRPNFIDFILCNMILSLNGVIIPRWLIQRVCCIRIPFQAAVLFRMEPTAGWDKPSFNWQLPGDSRLSMSFETGTNKLITPSVDYIHTGPTLTKSKNT